MYHPKDNDLWPLFGSKMSSKGQCVGRLDPQTPPLLEDTGSFKKWGPVEGSDLIGCVPSSLCFSTGRGAVFLSPALLMLILGPVAK